MNNKKTSKMFQSSDKKHKMKLRKTKKYKETKALTGQLQRSAIPTMQKLLNKNFKSKIKYNNTHLYQ